MRIRLSIATATAVAALTIAPASALALDTFVDLDTGDDANDCTQAAPGGPGVGPCATVTGGVAKAAPARAPCESTGATRTSRAPP